MLVQKDPIQYHDQRRTMAQVPFSSDFSRSYLHCKPDDRRKHRRLNCRGLAELRFLELGTSVTGTLLDLSVAGCCIECEGDLPADENPVVEVHLCVNGIRLRVAGVMRNIRRRRRRAGIEFVGVTARKAEQIRQLVWEHVQRCARIAGR